MLSNLDQFKVDAKSFSHTCYYKVAQTTLQKQATWEDPHTQPKQHLFRCYLVGVFIQTLECFLQRCNALLYHHLGPRVQWRRPTFGTILLLWWLFRKLTVHTISRLQYCVVHSPSKLIARFCLSKKSANFAPSSRRVSPCSASTVVRHTCPPSIHLPRTRTSGRGRGRGHATTEQRLDATPVGVGRKRRPSDTCRPAAHSRGTRAVHPERQRRPFGPIAGS